MTRSALISTLLAATVAAGCGGSGGNETNKAGAPVEGKRHVVTLQATDAGSDEAQYLARRIEQRSAGTLEVRLAGDYDSRVPANEGKLARALRAGDEEFAILPSRAWTTAGVPAFAALQAPFVLGTHDAARKAMAGAAGELLAGELRQADVEPLALVPTQLRRLLATRALTAPQRFDGARLRIVDNETTAAIITALGGEPRERLESTEVLGAIQEGRLDGAESAPAFILENGYGTVAKHLTGYALFDRVDTIVASPGALERLSVDQQKAVRAAAADTAKFAASQTAREDEDIVKLCRQGVRVDVPSAASLQALAAATAPVRAALARDAATERGAEAAQRHAGRRPAGARRPRSVHRRAARGGAQGFRAGTVPGWHVRRHRHEGGRAPLRASTARTSSGRSRTTIGSATAACATGSRASTGRGRTAAPARPPTRSRATSWSSTGTARIGRRRRRAGAITTAS